jgi:hypothetical protein
VTLATEAHGKTRKKTEKHGIFTEEGFFSVGFRGYFLGNL